MSQFNKPTFTLALNKKVLKSIFKTYNIKGASDIDLKNFLELASSKIKKQIKEELIKDRSLKLK